MRVRIQARGVRLGRSLRDHVEHQVRQSFDRVSHEVREIVINLSDLNGPRGGRDQRCAVMVRLVNGRSMILREVHESPFGAATAAIARMKRRLHERLARRRTRRRREKLLPIHEAA